MHGQSSLRKSILLKKKFKRFVSGFNLWRLVKLISLPLTFFASKQGRCFIEARLIFVGEVV
jgi:hypothetical protein